MKRTRAHERREDAHGPPAESSGLRTRRTALEVLVRVARERAYADVLLGHRMDGFAAPDRRLITQLVLGTIAWQGRLDYELERVSSRALDTLAPEVLAVLRMALFQLRILTRVPPHAAVDTAVTLARECAGEGLGRFVNAVLRNALRTPAARPVRAQDELAYLAAVHSHPRWLVAKFIEWFGARDAEALLAANNHAAPNVLRLNLTRGEADELAARLEREGFEIASRGRFPETVVLGSAPLFDAHALRDGICYPQAEASQLVARMLAPARDATVVDCAAAPGGKSAHLAELTGPGGKIIALDFNLAGLKKARALATRLGHRNVFVARADTTVALPLRPQSFGYVLLDAPCTGTGTMREHPEIRWRLRPDDFARMAELQARMLEQAAALVRPLGAIVYSVCSVAPDEGSGVVEGFLARHPEFALEMPPALRERLEGLIDESGYLRTRPDRGGLDGFFAARMIRRP
ncbi:MAG: 16S rRNA (cytosine(967)-C(5))-methyltransferase RsmB [Candidatus Binataceae bacterium]|jgi:16S rRNA (cytosine967-C5)-methyltransferase